jgi:hypothetical protein
MAHSRSLSLQTDPRDEAVHKGGLFVYARSRSTEAHVQIVTRSRFNWFLSERTQPFAK